MTVTPNCQWPKGCTNTAKKRNYCVAHYWKLHRSGYFRRALVDATPIRHRIQTHLDRDRRISHLAALAGLHHNHLANILAGQSSVTPDTAKRILSVPLRPSTIGCVRRIQAMQRLGYRIPDIAELAGVSLGTLRISMERARFTDHTATALGAVFDRLPPGALGPSRLTAHRAAAHGYPPPAAWEYVDIDDPAAVPDLGAQAKRSTAETAAEAAWLRAGGVSEDRIAQALGVTPVAVEQAEYRARKLGVAA